MNKEQYAKYLRGGHWKRLRAEKRRRVGKLRCAICGDDKQQIHTHHIFYRNIFDVTTSDLRLLCKDCHDTVHQLLKSGKLVITSKNHHGAFGQTKVAVKKARGFGNRNLFKERSNTQ